jgi:hypothetical protein
MVLKYSRPVIAAREYLDDLGRPVAYGRRRSAAQRQDQAHAVTDVYRHQERYEPVFTVADARIDYLSSEYAVSVDEDPRHASSMTVTRGEPETDLVRVVRIDPGSAECAPLYVGFGDRPGRIAIAAGSFSTFDLWFCGCGACDEPWEDVAEALEAVVLSLVAHGLTETIDPSRWGRARYWAGPTGMEWDGSLPKRSMRPEVLVRARQAVLKLEDGRWKPWIRRSDSVSHRREGR